MGDEAADDGDEKEQTDNDGDDDDPAPDGVAALVEG